MTRVNMIVEGQTEEAFVKEVLAPYLSVRNVFPVARRVTTNRKRRIRGGMTSYERAKKDIETWLKQDTSAYCTTMFDLYGLPSGFPGFNVDQQPGDIHQRVQFLERAFEQDINHHRFIAHYLLHEFEALLFSDPDKLDMTLSIEHPSRLDRLREILTECDSPEEINDHPETAPSKRLIQLYPGYDKIIFGVIVTQEIGVDAIREKCPHFNSWVSRLEQLAVQT